MNRGEQADRLDYALDLDAAAIAIASSSRRRCPTGGAVLGSGQEPDA
jgi:hypothetical protein